MVVQSGESWDSEKLNLYFIHFIAVEMRSNGKDNANRETRILN